MLRKDDSNKVLKRIKIVLFATTLSLMNPVEMNANTIDNITIEKSDDSDWKKLLNLCISIGAANLLVNLKFLYDFNKHAEDEDIEEIIDLIKPKR